ncbi:MAG: type II secretion system protein, partial [Enterococcus aquimarinus]
MRNKLKKIWNKEDGFTLVELLGVIVILGIILAIAVPALGNIISKARDNTANAEQELVIDAAQLYFVDQEATVNSVTVQVLEDNGFLQIKADSK